MCLGTPLFLMPWIMEAWLPASEKMWQPEKNWIRSPKHCLHT
jgi:hypothetical protein